MATTYEELSKEELLEIKSELEAEFEKVKAQGLKLDMSRGKPSTEQLNLSMGMMDVLNSDSDLSVRKEWTAAITVSWTAYVKQSSCLLI